jgi:hypothetical protein
MKYGEWKNGQRIQWIKEEEYKLKQINNSVITTL